MTDLRTLSARVSEATGPSRGLSANEIEVLEMLNGNRPGTWGAWVAACCESLKDRGYATGLYEITDAGRSALLAIHERKEP